MKKLVFLIILAAVFSARAQTSADAERQSVIKLNETVVSLYSGQKFDEALKAAR
ncbi:MAG: hypothetical protein H0U87_11195 [Acidobacteria bacterium]|nr:hypothetical protein [Acidobacteriota bacterium]